MYCGVFVCFVMIDKFDWFILVYWKVYVFDGVKGCVKLVFVIVFVNRIKMDDVVWYVYGLGIFGW